MRHSPNPLPLSWAFALVTSHFHLKTSNFLHPRKDTLLSLLRIDHTQVKFMTPTLNKFSSIKVLTYIARNNCNVVSATIIQVHKMLSRTFQLSYIHLHWARYFFILPLLPNYCSRQNCNGTWQLQIVFRYFKTPWQLWFC
jgi:hypothetical protein